MQCPKCKSFNVVYMGKNVYTCQECNHSYEDYTERKVVRPMRMSPYERTRAAVYATGNKWAIENFNATH